MWTRNRGLDSWIRAGSIRAVSRRAAIKQAEAEVWDLPPYSPDLNPIEKMWSKVKACLRKAKARRPQALYRAIADAMDQAIYEDIQGWFAVCSYTFTLK